MQITNRKLSDLHSYGPRINDNAIPMIIIPIRKSGFRRPHRRRCRYGYHLQPYKMKFGKKRKMTPFRPSAYRHHNGVVMIFPVSLKLAKATP